MAVCCAAIDRWSGSYCCPSMVAWARSTSLLGDWARYWVLRPESDAVFEMPTEHDGGLKNHLYLIVLGCLGLDRLLFGAVDRGDVVTVQLQAPCGNIPPGRMIWRMYDHNGDTVACNRSWIVVLSASNPVFVPELYVWKVVRGAPIEPMIQFSKVHRAHRIQFSPLCDDVIVIVDSGSVTFVDLVESFKARVLVVTLNFVAADPSPLLGVLWMPNGSLCTLHCITNSKSCFLLERTTGKRHQFQKFPDVVRPIGISHAFVMPMDTPQYQVYNTGNLASPSLCIPCTWARHHKPSGLIASTTLKRRLLSSATEIPLRVHDSVTGFCFGDFTVHVDLERIVREVEKWALILEKRKGPSLK
ncbi:hypothetical protein Pelo_16894 [Pelomyxa schiedti]|nr:hypothetical protein Pelo_16894 [Pelomyxa schiedti]